MKKVTCSLMGMLCLAPLFALAEWQVVEAQATDPFVQTSGASIDAIPGSTSSSNIDTPSGTETEKKPSKIVAVAVPLYQLDLQPGTLQENIQRINALQSNPWDIKWLAKDDFVVTGHPQVSGKDFFEAVGNLLQYYPVRAVFYKQNHVLAIVPRD